MSVQVGTQKIKEGQYEFVVWAPFANNIAIKPENGLQTVSLNRDDEKGYWRGMLNINTGDQYFIVINDKTERPDPASFFQPNGVHEASQLIDHKTYKWKDAEWEGISLEQMVVYELHIGTFTSGGTFTDVISKLDYLKELGINAIDIMPVAQFPGKRNWGYDGVYPFAVQNSYGGPEEFKKLIDHCHRKGIAVILDVVYNHLGPEGNYLADFGPYFTGKYNTPWGKAINFDDAWCDGVRNYFLRNALMWFEDYHIDGLRLDAIHAIKDNGAKHFLKELAEEVHVFNDLVGRNHYLIAESDLNDAMVITPWSHGGYGIDAQWCDDFHHALHAYLTGESQGYYQDFGTIEDLEKAVHNAFVYDWKYSSFRKKTFGNNPQERLSKQFMVYSQNHDQVGNRMKGERLSVLVPFNEQKLAAGAVLMSHYIPMLFMGEEYGEKKPFRYFVDHHDEKLVEAIKKGRKRDFRAFGWNNEPPDPKAAETFEKSCLSWKSENEKAQQMLNFYKGLIRIKKEIDASPLIQVKENMVGRHEELMIMLHRLSNKVVLAFLNFGDQAIEYNMPGTALVYKNIIDSEDPVFGGEKAHVKEINAGEIVAFKPYSVVVFENVAGK